MFGFIRKGQQVFTVKLPDYNQEFKVNPRQTILSAALEANIPWPKKCQVGSCGTCKCILLDGKTRDEIDFSYVLDSEEIQKGYILACSSTLKSDVSIEVNLNE